MTKIHSEIVHDGAIKSRATPTKTIEAPWRDEASGFWVDTSAIRNVRRVQVDAREIVVCPRAIDER
jgi:hypothetical protein